MIKEFAVNHLTIDDATNNIKEALKAAPVVKVYITDPSIGNWSMARLWRSWMASTADYMAKNGAVMPEYCVNGKMCGEMRPFNKNDAHEAFTIRYMGTDNKGNRYSWSKSNDQDKPQADKGQRYNALCQHQVWMIEKGIKFIDPKDTEFRRLCEHHGVS